MTSVLGYSKYAGQGGDWVRFPPTLSNKLILYYLKGSSILRQMGSLFPESLILMHYNMFLAAPEPNSAPPQLTEIEDRLRIRLEEFRTTGNGYFMIQMTKASCLFFHNLYNATYCSFLQPFTIGIAIASSPLAVLTYIGEKIYAWSDPNLVDPQDIINTVALYYLSGCFATSVVIYNQVSNAIQ